MNRFFIFLIVIFFQNCFAQSWPSQTWPSATNITSTIDINGVQDMSGLHFNPTNNRLYAVLDTGEVVILQWNSTSNTFTQLARKTISGGPEGITQANLFANEFYTIDENNYEIRRYTHATNFSNLNEYKHWNLLTSPSPMTDTGNTGPEGIVFIPDSFLTAIGFISQQTGQLYTSVKGLGGLFFVAHQEGGYIWVFDINPNTNNDFAYVGKYKTNKSESCDLSFDRSTGLLYILHNISGNNTLEVTNLATSITNGGNRKFVASSEYNIVNTNDSNDNIEGFALTQKCPEIGNVTAWLCRDVESNENTTLQKDVLKMFDPFTSNGFCAPLQTSNFENENSFLVYPNPSNYEISITSDKIKNATIKLINTLGQLVYQSNNNQNTTFKIDLTNIKSGIYILEINQNQKVFRQKIIKN